MNYIDLAIALIVVVFTVAGYKKGIFVSLLELVRYLVGIPLCFVVSDKYSLPIYQSYVRPRALESITKSIADSSSLKEINSALEEGVNSLPDFIAKSIDLSQINIKKSDVPEQILTKIFEPTLITLTKGALFIACFIVFFSLTGITLGIIVKARRKRENRKGKSLLSKGDRLVGAVFGICKSFVTIIALSAVLLYIQSISGDSDSAFFEQIDASHLLPLIENINPINYLIGG